MTTPTFDILMQRLERLEREVRWWRISGAGILAALMLVGLLGASGGCNPREVRAQRLVITDSSGKERARLFVDTVNDVFLSLLSSDGEAQAGLVARGSGFLGSSLFVSNGTQRGELSVAGNAAQIVLTDADWKSYMIATFGASSLILGKHGQNDAKPMAVFGTNPNSGGSLELSCKSRDSI